MYFFNKDYKLIVFYVRAKIVMYNFLIKILILYPLKIINKKL